MDENIKTEKEKFKGNPEDDMAAVQAAMDAEWDSYSNCAPGVDEFNDRDFGKVPVAEPDPEIYTLCSKITPEERERILSEFNESARLAGVRPIEGHPYVNGFYGEDAKCPILNNPDEIMVKIREVFHADQPMDEETENDASDKHFILSYIQSRMPKRKIGWKEGILYVDGAATNISYQSIASMVVKRLQKVFGNIKL